MLCNEYLGDLKFYSCFLKINGPQSIALVDFDLLVFNTVILKPKNALLRYLKHMHKKLNLAPLWRGLMTLAYSLFHNNLYAALQRGN